MRTCKIYLSSCNPQIDNPGCHVSLESPPTGRQKECFPDTPGMTRFHSQGVYELPMMGTVSVLHAQKKRVPWIVAGSLINCSLIEN